MFRIVDTQWLASGIKRFRIIAGRIAKKQQAGQFVIIRVHNHGERIPLTIADADPRSGTITLIVQGVGKTTKLMNQLDAGDALLDVVGPLGNPSDARRHGTVVVVGGGVGTAIAFPTAKAMKLAGNRVLSIIGARDRRLVILEREVEAVSDEYFVMTDDGSRGQRGLVTDKLSQLIAGEEVNLVLAIGPIAMMRGVAEITRPSAIATTVSLNSIMVDGTGMCGGCRVVVGGRARFACVDGPEFNAHQVDFELLARRNAMYKAAEQRALRRFDEDPDVDARVLRCQLADAHPAVAAILAAER